MQENIIFNKNLSYLKVTVVFHVLIVTFFLLSKVEIGLMSLLFSLVAASYLLVLFPSTLIIHIISGFKKPVFWAFSIAFTLTHIAYTMALWLSVFEDGKVSWSFFAQASAVILFLVILPKLIRNFDKMPVKLFFFSSILYYSLYMFL